MVLNFNPYTQLVESAPQNVLCEVLICCGFHREKAGEELKHDNKGFDMLYFVHRFILVFDTQQIGQLTINICIRGFDILCRIIITM